MKIKRVCGQVGGFPYLFNNTLFTDFARIGYGATWSPTKTGKKITHVTFKIPKDKSKGKTVKNSAPKQLPNALPAPAAPATVMRVNKNEPAPLNQVVQAATARQAGPTPPVVRVQDLSNLPNSEVTTRITTRLNKLKLTPSQIQKVFQLLGNDLVMMEKFMKVTHPLLRDFEANNKPFDNLAASTITLLKSEFPTFYRDKEVV